MSNLIYIIQTSDRLYHLSTNRVGFLQSSQSAEVIGSSINQGGCKRWITGGRGSFRRRVLFRLSECEGLYLQKQCGFVLNLSAENTNKTFRFQFLWNEQFTLIHETKIAGAALPFTGNIKTWFNQHSDASLTLCNGVLLLWTHNQTAKVS